MNVLSLFDGMSGAQQALDRLDIRVDTYYASEVDKYAIQITQKNYPNTIQLGSVLDLSDEELSKLDIDLLVGGSPCQGFSMAGKMKGSSTKCGQDVITLEQYLSLKEQNFEFDGQSYLFWEFIRVMEIIKPKYFLLENVRVTKKWLPMFNEAMGVEPILINSALLSAQNRNRFYWTNINGIKQPKDKGILLKDILESEVEDKYNLSDVKVDRVLNSPRGKGFFYSGDTHDKMSTVIAGYHKDPTDGGYIIDKSVKPSVAKNIEAQQSDIKEGKNGFHQLECTSGFQDNKIGITKTPTIRAGNNALYVLQIAEATKKGFTEIEDGFCFDATQPNSKTRRGRNMKDKCNYLTTSHQYMRYEYPTYRKITPLECERLQTVKDGYTEGVSNTQRYKMLGNGFTIDVIAHILKGMNL